MDGNEAQLAKIKDAIKKGELTKEIIERRLNAAIDAELRKTDSPADTVKRILHVMRESVKRQ